MAKIQDDPILASAAEKKFNRLRDEWKAKRGHEPSTMKIILIPAFQKIIGMGSGRRPFSLERAGDESRQLVLGSHDDYGRGSCARGHSR